MQTKNFLAGVKKNFDINLNRSLLIISERPLNGNISGTFDLT